jgi:UDP-N-acetylglucosamine--N-acetylmuramyl-(pentapeptide) pyrophosphoryl-undecaprenol N-acetylglucosamine transferase
LTLLAAPSLRPSGAGLRATARDAATLLWSIPQAIGVIRRLKPDVIFSTGGYIAIPTLIAAWLTRTPSLLWEGNVQAGRSNTLVAPLASHRAVAWPQTAERAPWRGATTTVTGTPVRELSIDRATARAARGLTERDQLLLVFGGSQRVRRFETALDGALTSLLTEWNVLHVVMDGLADAEQRRSRLPAEVRHRYVPVPFLGGGEMEAALVSADLMLGRAGASTIAEAAAAGLPAIIVPYPFAGGHQRANAEAAAAAGAATLISDEALTPDRLLAAVAEYATPAQRSAAARAARTLAHPDAALVIANRLLQLGGRG